MPREAVAVSKAVGVTTLDGLTDVTITSAATGEVLRYNGTAWVDAVLAIADVSGLQTALDARQPLDSDLTAIAALTTTSFGRSLLTQADAAATRTTIGAGTVGGSLGTTDNRVLRADGTGGSTAQGSAVTIDDAGSLTLPAGANFGWADNTFVVQSSVNRIWFRNTNNTGVFFTSTGVQVEGNQAFGIAPSQFAQNPDVLLYRVSSGVWGMGTTSNNALGSLNLANLTASGTVTVGGVLTANANINHTGGTAFLNTAVCAGDFYLGAYDGFFRITGSGASRVLNICTVAGARSRNYGNTDFNPFECSLLTLSGGLNLASRTKTAILASSPATNAGRFQLSDSGLVGREVYPDGTNWRYASDDSIVT